MGNQNEKPTDDASKYPVAHDVKTNKQPIRRSSRRQIRANPRTPNTPINNQSDDKHTSQETAPFNWRYGEPIGYKQSRVDLERDTRVFNPFVTEIQAVTKDTKPIACTTSDDNKSDNIPTNNQSQKPLTACAKPSIASFEFGELFGYWDPDSPTTTYIAPQFKSLKEEITNANNEIFLSTDVFEDEFESKATQKYDSMYNDKNDGDYGIYAKDKPYFNKLFGIAAGSKMSMDHILAIMLYTNTDELQKYFKQQTRKMSYNDDIQEVEERNRKYAHWFRLLFEVVWIFGDELKYNRKVYHGISCKLLFNKFQYDFKAPLSTTRDDTIAQNFCKDKGIVLVLTNGESHPQPYFCVEEFSRYSEKEYLFFGATLKICSIWIPHETEPHFTNLSKPINVLNFYMLLITGSDIERYACTQSKDNEAHLHKLGTLCVWILRLINKHMIWLNGEDATMDVKDDYIWDLFINLTTTNDRIWINKNELRYLKQTVSAKNNANCELVKYFMDDKDTIGEYLKMLLSHNAMKLSYAVEYEWIVDKNDLHELLHGTTTKQNGVVCDDYWDYFMDGDKSKMCTFGANMVVGYHDEDIKEDINVAHAVKKVGFYWRLSDIPDEYKSVLVSVEIYCPQIEFYIQFFNIKMSKSKSAGHTDLFAVSKLDDLDTFKWRIIMKCLPAEHI